MNARRSALVPALLMLWLATACDDADKDGAAAKSDEGKPEAKAETKAETKSADVDPSRPSRDWSAQALETVEDEVDGTKFALDLPEGLKKEVKKGDGTLPGYVTWNGANPFMDPTFTVQLDTFPPADVDAAAAKVERGTAPREVTRKEALEGGGILVSAIETSKKFVTAKAWQPSPSGGTLRVTLQVRSSDPIEDLDALRAWMEKVAQSLAAK